MRRNAFTAIATSLLAAPVLCATNASFTFPKTSDPAKAHIWDETIGANDSIVLEWTNLPFTPYVQLDINCTDTQQHAVDYSTGLLDKKPNEYLDHYVGPMIGADIYANQGKLRFNLAIAAEMALEELFYEGTEAYCYFYVANKSLTACESGPWGGISGNYSSQGVLFVSPVFRTVPASNTSDPSLWISAQDKNATAVAEATTVVPTCPPSGIPAGVQNITTTLDYWPPLQTGLTFPSKTYGMSDNEASPTER